MSKRGFRIGFAGSSLKHLTGELGQWRNLAKEIGYFIAIRGHTLISSGCFRGLLSHGNPSGLTGTTIESFYAGLTNKNPDSVMRRIVSYLPEGDIMNRVLWGQRLLCCDLNLQQRRRFWPSQADVVITLSGHEGTRGEIEGCDVHGTPVIPIGSSGEASLERWRYIHGQGVQDYYGGALSDEEFAKLNISLDLGNTVELAHFSEWVVICAEKVAAARFNLPPPASAGPQQPRVFLSHGRSEVWLKVQAYVQTTLEITCVELSQQPDGGRTIIEKLEAEARKCSYALVVMTAEDEMTDGTIRARENVIHEIGYLSALLGRSKVCILHEEGTNVPSNISGIVYKPFPRGNIKSVESEIEKELREAGLRRLLAP